LPHLINLHYTALHRKQPTILTKRTMYESPE